MESASKLFNLSDTYLDDYQYTDSSLSVRSSHELAEMAFIPQNLDGQTKRTLVKKHNKKTKVNPPQITMNSTRPDLTDIEIALIVSSYNTVPTSLIQHTLNISKRTVEDTYNRYKHSPLVQVPLIAISDTSRHLSEENLRYIYDSQDFHHIDDPLTNKELLRQDERKSNKEEEIEANLYKQFINRRLKENHTLKSPTGSARYIFTPKDFEEGYLGIYGRTWSDDFRRVFKKHHGGDVTYTINNIDIIPNNIPYIVKTTDKFNNIIYVGNTNYHLQLNNYIKPTLAKAYLDSYLETKNNKSLITEDSDWIKHRFSILPIMFQSSPNILADFFIYNPKDNYTKIYNKEYNVTYTTGRKDYQNYKPDSNNHLNLRYHIIRPPIYDRCIASPLQDKNKELRHTFPANTYKPLSTTTDNYDTTFPAVHCNNCSTFLSKHTVLTCKCKQITIDVKTLSLKKRTHNIKLKRFNHKHLKNKHKDLYNKIELLTTKHNLKTNSKVYAYGTKRHLSPNASINANLNHYTSSLKYQHQFNQTTKTFIQVFQAPEATFSFHLYNYSPKASKIKEHNLINITPNILPLYISFNFPLSNTSQEPYVT